MRPRSPILILALPHSASSSKSCYIMVKRDVCDVMNYISVMQLADDFFDAVRKHFFGRSCGQAGALLRSLGRIRWPSKSVETQGLNTLTDV